MPRFFGLANNQKPGDPEREDAEILGKGGQRHNRAL